jgi:hypothetical protein
MRHGFFFLLLYPGASWMLPAHFALQLSCTTFDASTDSQPGAADVRRPPVNHDDDDDDVYWYLIQ